jgi:Amt family ammonium transporter
MQIETASTLLLPLGIWLILSSGTPPHLHRRLAAASLITLAVATLAFYAVGFGLMFGGAGLGPQTNDLASLRTAISLPGSAQPWVFAGADGFLLHNAAQLPGLNAFVSYWPLVAACALLIAGVLAQNGRTAAQVLLSAVAAGVALPVTGCWLWGSGWLSALGANAGLGQGTIDIGKLSTAGIVAGMAATAWLVRAPRRTPATGAADAVLPPVHMPTRAIAGVICVLAGAVPVSVDPTLALGQFVNSSIVVSIAILTAGAYTLFTTRSTDVLSASRAALAAVFIASSGGALMPPWALAGLGLICGLLATIGYYGVNERLRWQDDSAIITSVLAPAALGFLAAGLFAFGDFGSEPGQLFAQSVGLAAIAALGYGVCAGALAVAARLHVPLWLSPDVIPTPAPTAVVAPLALPTAVVVAEIAVTSTADAAQPTPTAVEVTPAELAPLAAPPAAAHGSRLLAWLRGASADPLAPKQPRRVAYPYRANGRRLTTRPLATDGDDEPNQPLASSE